MGRKLLIFAWFIERRKLQGARSCLVKGNKLDDFICRGGEEVEYIPRGERSALE